MMTENKMGFVPSTFSDAGTGETFEGGKTHRFSAGAHANYAAAGLIGIAPSSPKRAPEPRSRKPAARASRSKSSTPTPAPPPSDTAQIGEHPAE